MQNKNNQAGFLFTLGVYLAMPVCSLYHGLLKHMPANEVTANVFFSLLLSIVLDQYIKRSWLKQDRRLQDRGLFLFLFLGANLLIAASDIHDYGFLWLLPVVMLVIGTGLEHAALVYVLLLIQNIVIHADSLSARELIPIFLYGIFCIWLLRQELTARILPYLFISMLAVDGILQILKYQFRLPLIQGNARQIVTELLSVVILELFIAAYLGYRKGREEDGAQSAEAQPMEAQPAEVQSVKAQSAEAQSAEAQSAKAQSEEAQSAEVQDRLASVLETEHALLLQLQEYSSQVFLHSKRIGRLAFQAAGYMDGDARLAQAGGLYHEIGKIRNEKNYIAAGVQLLQENEVPEEVIRIVRQHTGAERPQSLEAAIVMLADCIVSTSDYLEKAGRRGAISDEKLVNSIFANRIQKGSLAEAGLTEEQLKRLREFFVKQIFIVEPDETEG